MIIIVHPHRRMQKEVLELANDQEEQIYIKHDGSLNEGFEIVTHPMTLRYHRENMPWKEVCHQVVEQGYRSHMTDTCRTSCTC